MNRRQKRILFAAAAAIFLSSLFASWDLSGAESHTGITRRTPIFFPPEMRYHEKRSLSSSVPWTWTMIGLCSGLLLVAFHDPKFEQ